MQQGFIVRGGKSSWVTCAKDRPQQTVMLVFKKIPSKQQNYKQKKTQSKRRQNMPMAKGCLLKKWNLEAEVKEWFCHLFRGKATPE